MTNSNACTNLPGEEIYSFLSSFSSQHIERFVALTSKAAERAIGYTNRHRWILNHVASSKKIPTSAKKEDFINLVKQKEVEKVKKKICTGNDEF